MYCCCSHIVHVSAKSHVWIFLAAWRSSLWELPNSVRFSSGMCMRLLLISVLTQLTAIADELRWHFIIQVLKESFKIYCALNDGIIKLVDVVLLPRSYISLSIGSSSFIHRSSGGLISLNFLAYCSSLTWANSMLSKLRTSTEGQEI